MIKNFIRFFRDPQYQESLPWVQWIICKCSILHPNYWTSSRIVGGILSCCLFYIDEIFWAGIAMGVFALTDWIDGKTARFSGLVSEKGAFLDALADKFFILPILFFQGWKIVEPQPEWQVTFWVLFTFMVLAEISRPLMLLSKRFQKKHVHSIIWGKYKFILQIFLAFALWIIILKNLIGNWSMLFVLTTIVAITILSLSSMVFRLYPEWDILKN